MPLLKFMKKLNFGVGDNRHQTNLTGRCAMFALEDMINVNANNNIAIAYEINRSFGGYLTTSYKNQSLGHRYDIQRNDVPA